MELLSSVLAAGMYVCTYVCTTDHSYGALLLFVTQGMYVQYVHSVCTFAFVSLMGMLVADKRQRYEVLGDDRLPYCIFVCMYSTRRIDLAVYLCASYCTYVCTIHMYRTVVISELDTLDIRFVLYVCR